MGELGKRILRRSIPVAITLGLMGYLFAEIFLMMHRMNGGAPDPANEAIRWRTPLTMAGIGVAMLAFLELLTFAVKRKHAPPPIVDDHEKKR